MLMPHHRATQFINDFPDLEMEAERLKGCDTWLIVIDQKEIPDEVKAFIDAHATYYYERQLELPLDLDLPLTSDVCDHSQTRS